MVEEGEGDCDWDLGVVEDFIIDIQAALEVHVRHLWMGLSWYVRV